ncbi:MAG: hypothetical protein HQL20_11455 [Candidatus Omnitrophica bacterium]|nr:hypothetical protein [Candidatus Omnitrophota bacterium]
MRQLTVKLSIFIAAVFVLPGCSLYRIDYQDTTRDYYPPKSSKQDVVYLEKIDKPHEFVGVVVVSVENTRPLEDVLQQMRGQAALLGGDAITAVSSGPEGLMRTCYKAKVAVYK